MGAPGARPPKYDCSFGPANGLGGSYTGSTAFSSGLACQYIDITSVPPGDYVLQMIVNPDNKILEANYDNNVTLVPVTIPPTSCNGTPRMTCFPMLCPL